MLDKAVAAGRFISFDPNYRHLLFRNNNQSFIEQSLYFLDRCHFFKVSDEEAMLLTGTTTLDAAVSALLRYTHAVFAITLGKDGTLLGHNNSTTVIPSIPVQPVDTTGAGDAFVGAVLYQLSRYAPGTLQQLSAADWHTVVHNANKAGARTCEYMGAMEAFRHLSSDIFN